MNYRFSLRKMLPSQPEMLCLILLLISPVAFAAADDCLIKPLALVNAKVLTMDSSYTQATALLIYDNKIRQVSTDELSTDDCTNVIDLEGRTVIPGIIDSHSHFIRQANMPGNDTRHAETVRSIKEFQAVIAKRAREIPADNFISVMGGVVPQQIQPEGRLPNLAELDLATSNHPVYIQMGFSGPAMTNTLGKLIFTKAGVTVSEDGSIAMGKDANLAFATIKATQTREQQLSSIRNLMAYSNQLGMTSIHDQGGVVFPGGGFFDVSTDYDEMLSIWRKGEMTVRIRAHLGAADSSLEAGGVEARLNNAWSSIGDDMFRMSAMGEHVVTFPRDGKISAAYSGKVLEIAKHGWTHEQHSVSDAENIQHFNAIKKAHSQYPITNYRWSLSHVFEVGHAKSSIDLAEIDRLGMGLKLQSQGYVMPTNRFPLGRTLEGNNSGPLYRTLYDSGIPLGAGTDGILVVPMNPWHSIYYMVTGRDIKGELVNPGQTLTRLEALQLYTTGSAWFSFDEDKLGSIEVGKLADIVVLSDDYLNIEVEKIKMLESVLTIVDGKIVYRKGI